MKISYSWLKEHIALTLAPEELAAHLTRLGFEVDEIQKTGASFSGIVAAEILEVGKHPNADRLSLCKVSDGKDTFSVICGGKNLAVGQRIPLARIGASLPGGEIKRAKIRGVQSQGMICSGDELGLDQARDGDIMVLDPKTPLGSDIADMDLFKGTEDHILEVDITPNRPDCLSHLGLARELSAFLGLPLKKQTELSLSESGDCFPIEVKDTTACPRYLGRLITEVRVGPSPGWLALKLKAMGLRPINNIVDITNFILMDTGQPMHAFDADKLEGGRIIVRRAAAGERLKALDGKDYTLTPECLVIADAKKPVAVAGVMGGESSAVTAKTKRALLECAYFDPTTVRRTSQLLRLRSDSSYRFERGCDIGAVDRDSRRAAALIAGLTGKPTISKAADAGGAGKPAPKFKTSTDKINALLGSSFKAEEIEKTLKAIGTVTGTSAALSFGPPSHRHDLATTADLAEETARLIGYDKIPSKLPSAPLEPSRPLRSHTVAERCRARLAALGLTEAYNYDFLSEKNLAASRIPVEGLARLSNPISEDWAILRPSLMTGLLQSAQTNINAGAKTVRLFEIGKTYRMIDGKLSERTFLAGLILGPSALPFWKNNSTAHLKADVYEAKGLVMELLDIDESRKSPDQKFRLAPRPECDDAGFPVYNPSTTLDVTRGGDFIGLIGELHPKVLRAWDLQNESVAAFELDLFALADLPPKAIGFTQFSVLPGSKRDLSFLIDEKITFQQVWEAAFGCGIGSLRAVDLSDYFDDKKKLPEGKKSLTIRLEFESKEKTLTDEEVNAGVEKIVNELAKKFGSTLRT